MNHANKKTDQNLSDFLTGIGATANDTLDKKPLICCARPALVDTIASLQGSDGGAIATWKVNGLLTMIHDIWIVLCVNGLLIHFLF